jgi:hypothetical protein
MRESVAMKNPGGFVLFLALGALAAASPARGGHEAPLYPSYYPQEIRIEAVAPASAGRLLAESAVHAYVGREPIFTGPVPKSIRHVESLGSFVVVRVNPNSAKAKNGSAACAVAGTILKALAADLQGFVPHPYPITPYHADYLHHADRADAVKKRFLSAPAAVPGLRVQAQGAWAEKLTRGRWPDGGPEWDARIEEVDIARLVALHRFVLNGWFGPPWLKEGWFHAYLLLAPMLADPDRARAAAFLARLQSGALETGAEKINLERDLVALLTAGCRTVVAGYAVKREYYSAQYSDGIENIAFDSHAGLNAPIFVRTVKLKDFPWNGWLRLGVPEPPTAAWNPFGGFGDEAGRLIWWALGDPALFPEPYNAGWTLNRIGDVRPAK